MNKFTNEEKGIEELILHLSSTTTTNPNQTIYRKSKSQKKLNQKTKALRESIFSSKRNYRINRNKLKNQLLLYHILYLQRQKKETG